MPKNNSQTGFSLLEYVLGLTVLAIVLVGVGIYLVSYPRQLDPVFQFRAVALAEAIAEQVITVKYDHENNPYDLNHPRCGISSEAPECKNQLKVTNNSSLDDFSAVDDFQLWCSDDKRGATGPINGVDFAERLNLPEANLYRDFTIETCVELPTPEQENNKEFVKKVAIIVNVGSRDKISFHLDRYNIR